MDNQNIINQKIVELNTLKEQLQDLNWAQIKDNKKILNEALSTELEINAGDMLLLTRTSILSQIFKNFQKINQSQGTKILKIFIEYDLSQGIDGLQKNFDQLIPGLVINKSADLANLQQSSKGLVNGLHNIKKIALMKIAEEIFLEVSYAKKISPNQIGNLLNQLNLIINGLQIKIDKYEDPTLEEVRNAANFLKNLGRTPFEIEQFKNTEDIMLLISLLRKSQEALEVVQEAHRSGLINKLSDIAVIAEILEKIKSK